MPGDSLHLALVTPSLNQAGLLAECIRNVAALGQVEHVVSDGGSTDATLPLLERAATESAGRVRYRSGADRGMYDAIIKGIALTSAPIIGYLNCDDLLMPWTAQRILDLFTVNPSIDFIVGDSLQLRGATRLSLTAHPPSPGLRTYVELGGVLAQPAVFYRRKAYERLGGFDPGYRFLGDQDLWWRALHAGCVFYRDVEVYSVERMVPGQQSERFRAAVRQEHMRLLRRRFTRRDEQATRFVSAGIHRAALATYAGLGLSSWGPWCLTRRSGYARVRRIDVARALVQHSSHIEYLSLTDAGHQALVAGGNISSAP